MPSLRTGAAMAADLKRTAHAVRMRADLLPDPDRCRRMTAYEVTKSDGSKGLRYRQSTRVEAAVGAHSHGSLNFHAVATSTGRRARVRKGR